MKPALLLLGSLHPESRQALAQHFDVHPFKQYESLDTFLKLHAQDVVALLTNGHDGASATLINRLPSLKIIACNGVGYDAVDAACAVERKILDAHTHNVYTEYRGRACWYSRNGSYW